MFLFHLKSQLGLVFLGIMFFVRVAQVDFEASIPPFHAVNMGGFPNYVVLPGPFNDGYVGLVNAIALVRASVQQGGKLPGGDRSRDDFFVARDEF